MPESEAVQAHSPSATTHASTRQILDTLGACVTIVRPRCYRSEDRLRCTDDSCRWRAECRRLIAEWRR